LSFPPRIVCGINSSPLSCLRQKTRGAFSLWTPAPSTHSASLRAGFAQDRFRRGDIVDFCFPQQILNMKPGRYPVRKADDIHHNILHIRAVNRGPLPAGFTYYMQQETDSPNRDRKPDNPRVPMMIYLVKVRNKG